MNVGRKGVNPLGERANVTSKSGRAKVIVPLAKTSVAKKSVSRASVAKKSVCKVSVAKTSVARKSKARDHQYSI